MSDYLFTLDEPNTPTWKPTEEGFVAPNPQSSGELKITPHETIGKGMKAEGKCCFRASLSGGEPSEVALLVNGRVGQALNEIELTERYGSAHVGIPPIAYGTFAKEGREYLGQIQPLCTQPEERLKAPSYPLSERIEHTVQLFSGLAELAEKRMTHCDLRLDNLLITPFGTLKIIDLEFLSTEKELEQTTQVRGWKGDAGILPPDIKVYGEANPKETENQRVAYLTTPQSPQTDLYAAGLITQQLVGGLKPQNPDEERLLQGVYHFLEGIKFHWETKSAKQCVEELKGLGNVETPILAIDSSLSQIDSSLSFQLDTSDETAILVKGETQYVTEDLG